MVTGKGKTFYMQTRILGPIFITSPVLILGPIFIPSSILISTLSIITAPTNTSTLYYGLILPNSKVTAIRSDSMVTTTNSVVLLKLQVYS